MESAASRFNRKYLQVRDDRKIRGIDSQSNERKARIGADTESQDFITVTSDDMEYIIHQTVLYSPDSTEIPEYPQVRSGAVPIEGFKTLPLGEYSFRWQAEPNSAESYLVGIAWLVNIVEGGGVFPIGPRMLPFIQISPESEGEWNKVYWDGGEYSDTTTTIDIIKDIYAGYGVIISDEFTTYIMFNTMIDDIVYTGITVDVAYPE